MTGIQRNFRLTGYRGDKSDYPAYILTKNGGR